MKPSLGYTRQVVVGVEMVVVCIIWAEKGDFHGI